MVEETRKTQNRFKTMLYSLATIAGTGAAAFIGKVAWDASAALESLKRSDEAQWSMLRDLQRMESDFAADKELRDRLIWPFLQARLNAELVRAVAAAPPAVTPPALTVPPVIVKPAPTVEPPRFDEPLHEFRNRQMEQRAPAKD